MTSRYVNTVILVIGLVILLTLSASAQTVTTVALGVNSSTSGYTVPLRIDPGMNFLTFARVSPVVNMMRIRDVNTGSDVYFGCPIVGTRIFLPTGSYEVTGWCAAYGDDTAAVVAALAPDADTPINITQDYPRVETRIYRDYEVYYPDDYPPGLYEKPGTIHTYRYRSEYRRYYVTPDGHRVIIRQW